MVTLKKFLKRFEFYAEEDLMVAFHITPAIIGTLDGGIGIGIYWGVWAVAISYAFPQESEEADKGGEADGNS